MMNHMYIYPYTYIDTYIYIHIYKHICIYILTSLHIQIYLNIQVYLYTKFAYKSIWIYLKVCKYMYAYMYVYIYICIFTYLYMYMYIYTYMYLKVVESLYHQRSWNYNRPDYKQELLPLLPAYLVSTIYINHGNIVTDMYWNRYIHLIFWDSIKNCGYKSCLFMYHTINKYLMSHRWIINI
jgi:hypothetical protein